MVLPLRYVKVVVLPTREVEVVVLVGGAIEVVVLTGHVIEVLMLGLLVPVVEVVVLTIVWAAAILRSRQLLDILVQSGWGDEGIGGSEGAAEARWLKTSTRLFTGLGARWGGACGCSGRASDGGC